MARIISRSINAAPEIRISAPDVRVTGKDIRDPNIRVSAQDLRMVAQDLRLSNSSGNTLNPYISLNIIFYNITLPKTYCFKCKPRNGH